MLDLTQVEHHPAITEIVDVLCAKTQNNDRGFFQTEVAYYLCKMAASMRVKLDTKDRGEIPVNLYALALATSGFGKGHSVSIMEEEFTKLFERRFLEDTMPVINEQHLNELATDRAIRNGTDQQEEVEKIEKEFRSAGAYAFTFDSATPPAVKQMRHKLLLGGIGSINLQIDEIGSNLINNQDVLVLFLELFDQGKVKQKLTKNTNDSQRGEEINGKTPTNALLFGTPNKLLDGGQTEDQFYTFLDTGYARRCLYGYGAVSKKAKNTMTPEEIYDRLTQPTNMEVINKWQGRFHDLADPAMFGWKIDVKKDVGVELLRYKIFCEDAAEELKDHQDIQKAELSHRYFKALKLAGAFAFVDKSTVVEIEHLYSAIKLVEESGQAFAMILNREKSYVKLAKYITDVGEDLTHADLHEALPFYKSGNAARNEQMNLAMAWGYKQHRIIKKTFIDGIEFFRGEKLQETDIDDMILSYSHHWAFHYDSEEKIPFDQLHVLTQAQQEDGDPMHWANHKFTKHHRAEENVIQGFNMLVIDVDGGATLEAVHELLAEYKYMTYTTKRHTDQEQRFRLILPMNYTLQLDSEDYKEFMNCVMDWLPFKVDPASNQRSKKWETFAGGSYHYNMDGEMIDVLRFIPKTSKHSEYQNSMKELASLDNLERWFAQRMESGNRNNQMIKFALALVDTGKPLHEVNKLVHAFNKKMKEPLPETELDSTIMVTVSKRFEKRN